MRESLVQILRCPSCAAEGDWELATGERDAIEIRDGELRCRRCDHRAAIDKGIVDLLYHPPEFVIREAAGLGRFAQTMRADGWTRDRIVALPDAEHGYWWPQRVRMEQLLDRADALRPGARILDVGANTCWASALLAEHGLDVVALDISRHDFQGLETADVWFEARDVFFERVLGVMYATPFASASFDAIFCSEVLHHNHRANLHRTMAEFARLLRPGGVVIVMNEPVRAILSPKLRPGSEVAAYEGHEHAYLRASYVRAARAADLCVELVAPRDVGIFNGGTWGISPATTTRSGLQMALAHALRRRSWARRAFLAWKTYVGGVSLYMTATKPVRLDA